MSEKDAPNEMYVYRIPGGLSYAGTFSELTASLRSELADAQKEVERLTAERDEARATKDMHKERQQREIERAELSEQREQTMRQALEQMVFALKGSRDNYFHVLEVGEKALSGWQGLEIPPPRIVRPQKTWNPMAMNSELPPVDPNEPPAPPQPKDDCKALRPYLCHGMNCGAGGSVADSLAGSGWEQSKHKWRDCTCGLAALLHTEEPHV